MLQAIQTEKEDYCLSAAERLELKTRYLSLLERIDRACAKYGRSNTDLRIIAVSKLHSASAIEELAALGQKNFGENYVQEAMRKRSELKSGSYAGLDWHFLGHIQSRKAGLVAGEYSLIHSLDSRKLADCMEKSLQQKGLGQAVLIEVNIASEPQKSGIVAEEAEALAKYVLEKCPRLHLCGLMCLPPVFDAGDAVRPYFAKLRKLRDKLESKIGISLPELSMGMSGDFEAAIAEGASMVRIGTGIFGARPIKVSL